MNNPLIPKNKKSKEAHFNAIAKGLNVQPIANHSPDYQTATAVHYPAQGQYITVTLDKLRPYEHNPRKTRNPNFEMIKESIRRRGLDHKPNITRRPGEPFYIIADGGNTRIQALKELFTETQDQRFWAIECYYKEWKGETADSVEDELNLLIGHLIENDTRADLSFIEKALGIQQAKVYYEKKLGQPLSARELAGELEKDGYIIHQTNVSKMERCLEFLYPYIPTILFNGLGHSPIDKLLSIRNNAVTVWENYQFNTDITFEDIWANSLSRCDQDNPFESKVFQDYLIQDMVAALGDPENVSYEVLYLEIDLDEQRFKKLAQKQHEINQSSEESRDDITAFRTSKMESSPRAENEYSETSLPQSTSTLAAANSLPEQSAHHVNEALPQPDADTLPDFTADIESSSVSSDETDIEPEDEDASSSDFAHHLETQFGITPGMNIQEQRQQRAAANGLSFACCGRQPVDDIWQIYPGRQHKLEAYSLALDIAESVGLTDYVEHVVNEPVDYTYRMKPLDKALNGAAQMCYDFLCLLQTDTHPQTSFTLVPEYLLNTQEINDVVIVKFFRLLRLARYIRTQGASHDHV